MKNILRRIYNLTVKKLINNKKTTKYGYFGDYNSWDEVKNLSTGYESDVILEKVKNSICKVKNGEAIFERDSFLFDKIEYSWPLLAGLLYVSSQNNGQLRVLDFGGSLGSHYFQNRSFLTGLNLLKWCIVEQEKFVKCGKENFESDVLKFYYNIDECIKVENPNVAVLSGVIQYLEEPYKILDLIVNKNINYIIFDRTSFSLDKRDILTLQIVPPSIYDASYPAWFLNEEKFLDMFKNKYRLFSEFESFDKANIPSIYKGFIFQRL